MPPRIYIIAMNLLRFMLMKFAVPVPDITKYHRFLFIGPHPDDIEIGAGATAARLAAEGKSVCFLICTDGRYGDGFTELRGDALVACRKQESIASAATLGVKDVRFLNLSDGGFYEMDALIHGIAGVVGDFQPEVIFAPDPSVTSECHQDHLNVGLAARRIACFAPYAHIMEHYDACNADVQALAYYFTAKGNCFVGTKGYKDKQLASIFACHQSQFPENGKEGKSIGLYLKLRSIYYGIKSFRGSAEVFRVLGQTHIHCFPEGGN